jgi:hypothetical protein
MRFRTVFFALLLGGWLAAPALADDLSNQLDAARAAYAKGDSLRTLSAVQAAISLLNARLLDQFAKVMPPAPAGWDAGPPESQLLDTIGGGYSLTRGYTKGESTLNASLIVDNPAVTASTAMFQAAPQVASQPGWSRLKVGTEDALVRFDPTTRAGEILLVIGGRVLLQIEGTEIAAQDVLVETAKGWNVAAIRKMISPS